MLRKLGLAVTVSIGRPGKMFSLHIYSYCEELLIFEPENWEVPDKDQWLGFFNHDKDQLHRNHGSWLVFRKHLSPLVVYKYLVARFGPPNGFQTFIKKQRDSDNLFNWDFLITAGDHRIWFQGGNRDVHVAITNKKLRPTEWVKFVTNLKVDFAQYGREMADVGKRLQKWMVVSNKFALIADACAEHHEVLHDNQKPPNFKPPKRTSKRGINQYHKRVRGISERANRVFNSSICLDLLTPVLAESYINLLIFIMRRDELKTNKRQYDAYVRQPIDTRVFDLHLKCDNFVRGVDEKSNEYKNFKKVMDRRNHKIHGNIDPMKDIVETVYFDDYIPLFEEGGDPILKLFENKEAVFDTIGVLERYLHVHEFMAYLNSLISVQFQSELKMIIEDSTFGFDAARQKSGRLFPSHEIMMLSTWEYDDELNVDWNKSPR